MVSILTVEKNVFIIIPYDQFKYLPIQMNMQLLRVCSRISQTVTNFLNDTL